MRILYSIFAAICYLAVFSSIYMMLYDPDRVMFGAVTFFLNFGGSVGWTYLALFSKK